MESPTHDGHVRLSLTVNHDGTMELESCPECGKPTDTVLMLLRVSQRILEFPPGGDDLGPIETQPI